MSQIFTVKAFADIIAVELTLTEKVVQMALSPSFPESKNKLPKLCTAFSHNYLLHRQQSHH